MAFHKISNMDAWEVLRRWHSRQSISHIARILGYDRKTVRRYVRLARAKGLSQEAPLPSKEEVLILVRQMEPVVRRSAQAQVLLDPLLVELVTLVSDQDLALKPKIAFEVLCQRHQLAGKVSYTSFKRFVRTHQIALRPELSTCRREVPPASEVQIDYAKVAILYDPLTQRRRTLHAFIGTLGFSRHKYVELVFSQDQLSFIGSHIRMFEYFGGVPERVVLDNLKTGVIKPDLYDPSLNRTYRELADHYHCFLDPCRIAQPKDKGKVERDVPTVRQAVRKLIVLHPTADITELNRLLRLWCTQDYGQRKHGTTQSAPYCDFLEQERPALKGLPQEGFEAAEWKEATVHPDHYIQFNRKAYSVPHPYVGRKVWVRATERLVQIYYADELIKQHLITRFFRHTDHTDFPENVRAVLDEGVPRAILKKAQAISPHLYQLLRSLLEVHAFINLRKAQGLLALADHFNHALIDTAAAFAIQHRLSLSPKQFRHLLEKLQAAETTTTTLPLSQQSLEFIRDITYFISSPQETST